MSVLARFRLDCKVALVTGGARGLGRVMAGALAEAGASVALTARSAESALAAAAEISSGLSAQTLGLRADVTREADIDAMVSQTLDRFGRLDILVNNAGVNIRKPIEQFAVSEWDQVIDANLKAPWLCCRAVLEPMKRQKWGRVINVSSILGEVGMADRTPYCASKGGLTLLSRTLALEWAPYGINVNALCPGPFATEINLPLMNDPAGIRGKSSLEALGRSRRNRTRDGIPCLGRGQLHDRGHPVRGRGLHSPMRLQLTIGGCLFLSGISHRSSGICPSELP
jgi:NAD(P)-dependent dehydrogenase (short-subunit alcohol dehydrogenase family)